MPLILLASIMLAVSADAAQPGQTPGQAPGETSPPAPAGASPAAPAPAPPPAEAGPAATRVLSGHRFTEGPVWIAGAGEKDGGYLLFSDIPADTIFKWTPGEEKASVFRKPSNFSNGLCLDAQGRLLAAEHGRRVTRGLLDSPGEAAAIADAFEGKRLNSPNDLCVHPSGVVFFTDPPYGLRGALGPGGKSEKELEFQGVYRLGTDGALTTIARGLPTPNGIALSPDRASLYVADTSRGLLHVFDLDEAGNPKPETADRKQGRILAKDLPGADGVKCDVRGRIYVAARGGVAVFSPAGERVATISTGRSKPTNLCFGGANFSTLYITVGDGVMEYASDAPGDRLTPAAP